VGHVTCVSRSGLDVLVVCVLATDCGGVESVTFLRDCLSMRLVEEICGLGLATLVIAI
jgi:hypothetical protein